MVDKLTFTVHKYQINPIAQKQKQTLYLWYRASLFPKYFLIKKSVKKPASPSKSHSATCK